VLGTADNPDVRVVNALTTPAQVDIVINNQVVGNDVGFGAVSNRTVIDNGNRTIEVRDATTQGVIVSAERLLELSTDYTVVAYNNNNTPSLLRLRDRRTATSGKADFRFIHVANGAGPVDVYVTEPNADISNAAPTISGVTIGDEEQEYQSFDADTYQVRITAAGTKNVIASQQLSVVEGQNRTFLVVSGNNGPQIITLEDLG